MTATARRGHAEANDHVGRNVASFVKPPQGKTGRPSRAMTAAEAAALLAAAKDHPRLGAYVILSLTTGIRTEEVRALPWDHVDLDGDPAARTPVPPNIAVWRSVRQHGDTKTEKSRRTLALPQSAVASLREHRKWQAEARLAARPLWQDTGLVFTSSLGTPLDASHVRRDFRTLCKKAGIEGVWAPRELRHTFVSVMSESGVARLYRLGALPFPGWRTWGPGSPPSHQPRQPRRPEECAGGRAPEQPHRSSADRPGQRGAEQAEHRLGGPRTDRPLEVADQLQRP
jgi:integrase